jgi:hypothetical protein
MAQKRWAWLAIRQKQTGICTPLRTPCRNKQLRCSALLPYGLHARCTVQQGWLQGGTHTRAWRSAGSQRVQHCDGVPRAEHVGLDHLQAVASAMHCSNVFLSAFLA